VAATAHSFRIPQALWDALVIRSLGEGKTSTAVMLEALAAHLGPAPREPDALSDGDAAEARAQFTKGAACLHCGGLHLRACPRVRRLSWRNKEDLAEVEYWAAGRWDPGDTVFPEDVFAEGHPEPSSPSG